MRIFNYGKIGERTWDSEILGLVSAIHREAGKQELFLKQRPQELEKLVAIAKVQSIEASNAIEGIVTTDLRIRRLVENRTVPKNRDEAEIAGYRDVLSIIHENYEAIPLSKNYILQLHKVLYGHLNNPMAGRI
ncbi:MAG: Fic family protein, partial [Spirochaetales bacterium]|nr:Fic family protein [Spirochaetales bacterium]